LPSGVNAALLVYDSRKPSTVSQNRQGEFV
jgi:hypothetical protein